MTAAAIQHVVRVMLDAVVQERPAAPVRWWMLPLIVAMSAVVFGVAMGSFDLSGAGRLKMPAYAGMKVPMLFLVTTSICLPGYFVLSTVMGLRADFRRAMTAIVAGQAGTALALASLAPVIRFIYAGGVTHAQALMWSAAMFGVATAAGYAVMLRRYRGLIEKNRRHRLMLVAWITMYAFVGVQMGWMLRPFVGTPGIPVTFVRQEPFSNAYVAVGKIFVKAVTGRGEGN